MLHQYPGSAEISAEDLRTPQVLGTRAVPLIFLTGCLLSPALFSIVRKLLPGQPVYLEVGSSVVVLAVAVMLLLFYRAPRLPVYLRTPLLLWAALHILYAVFSIGVDYRVGLTASMVRIVPILMVPIAYKSLKSINSLSRLSAVLGILAVLLLPAAVLVALGGPEVVPQFLRPIERFIEIGREHRSGIPTVSAIFSTNAVLSMSAMALYYLSNMSLSLDEQMGGRKHNRWLVFLFSSVALVFLSVRRGAFYMCVVGLFYYLVRVRRTSAKTRVQLILVIIVLAVGVSYLDTRGHIIGKETRGEFVLNLDLRNRVEDVFFGSFSHWLTHKPLGSYLGYGGPERVAFIGEREDRSVRIEVGAAQLAVEMGAIGAFGFLILIGTLVFRIHRRARNTRFHGAVSMLLAFQVAFSFLYYTKEASAMNGVSMAQLLFWASFGMCARLIEWSQLPQAQQLPPEQKASSLSGHQAPTHGV
ncbi:MAG: oligosaccharide repeat unit polymerase [Bradymonadales bacterium]|nr:oligosaccharide repeat unit polymerase [Bradymonadales bacterium]